MKPDTQLAPKWSTTIFSLISLAGISLILSGCGNGLPAGKVRAMGKVLLDGQPITHTGDGLFIVNLASKENSNTSTARFDKTDGTFEIIIEPGEYIASVTATDGFDQDDERRGRVIPAKSLVPEKYKSLDTSDAAVVVPANGGEILVQLMTE
ncbi:MAG: hypothetical protein ACO37F_06585 [Pirellulales bacterium]